MRSSTLEGKLSAGGKILPLWTDSAELAEVFQATPGAPELEGWKREILEGWDPSLLSLKAEGILSSVWWSEYSWVDLALYSIWMNLRTISPFWFSLPRAKHFLNYHIISVISSPFLCTLLLLPNPANTGPLLSNILHSWLKLHYYFFFDLFSDQSILLSNRFHALEPFLIS